MAYYVSAYESSSGVELNRDAMYVSSNGVAIDTVINAGGAVTLLTGGMASKTVISSGGALHVYSGAYAEDTEVNRYGYFGIGSGAVASNTSIGYAGELTVWGGGVVNDNVINEYGAIILSSGAVANSTTINSRGGLHVYSGAVASNTTVSRGGVFGVGLGAKAYDTTIAYAGELTVWGGGVVNDNVINEYGAIILSSGALADSTVINSGGGLHVYSGAGAGNTTGFSGGFFGVGLGAKVYDTTIAYAGALTVWGGGVVNDNVINEYGAIILSSGAVANSTTINAGGGLHIYSGAVAYSTEIVSGAALGIGGGGKVFGTKLSSGATMTFYNGSILAGWNDFAGEVYTSGTVKASGSYLNLQPTYENFSYFSSYYYGGKENISIINDLSDFSGSYQLRVKLDDDSYQYDSSPSMLTGYYLAENASKFNSTINLTVKGVDLGAVKLNNSVAHKGYYYTFEKNAGDLMLLISDKIIAVNAPGAAVAGVNVINITGGIVDEIYNFGEIPDEACVGFVNGTNGVDRVIFSGNKNRLVDGISLYAGDDEVILQDETVDYDCETHFAGVGSVNFGEGNNKLVTGVDSELESVRNITFGNGNDNIILNANSEIEASCIDMGNGTNTITLNEEAELMVSSLVFGSGNDTVTVGADADLYADYGNCIVEMGSGNDRIVVNTDGDFKASFVDFGSGNDTLVLNGVWQFNNYLLSGEEDAVEGGFAGLENFSGSGEVVFKEVGDVRSIGQTALEFFKSAGIRIINAGEDEYTSFKSSTYELSDNTFASASDEFDEDDGELEFWLCGANKAASMEYGFCDSVDFVRFLADYDEGEVFAMYGSDVDGVSVEIFNAHGTKVDEWDPASGVYELDNLNVDQQYVLKISVASDSSFSGGIQIFDEDHYYEPMSLA